MSAKIDRRLLDTNAAAMGGGVGLAVLESMFSLVQSQSVMNAAMVRDYQLSHPMVMESLAVALNEILCPCGDPDDRSGADVIPIRGARRRSKARRRPPEYTDRVILGDDEPYDPSGAATEPDVGSPTKAVMEKRLKTPGDGGGDGGNADVQELAQVLGQFVEEIKTVKPQGGGGGSTDVQELTQVLSQFVEEFKNAKPHDGGGAEKTTTTTKTSEHVESAAQLDALLSVVNMVGKQMESMIDVNKSALTAPMLMVT